MSFKSMQIHLTDLSKVGSKFDHDPADTKRDRRTTAKDKKEWSRSFISFEYPSDTKSTWPSSSVSSPTATHKMCNNYQHIPMTMSKKVLSLIADEVGITVSELSPTMHFEDVGLDSLLSLSLVDQLRQEGLGLPTSIFWDFPTVQELEAFLDGL